MAKSKEKDHVQVIIPVELNRYHTPVKDSKELWLVVCIGTCNHSDSLTFITVNGSVRVSQNFDLFDSKAGEWLDDENDFFTDLEKQVLFQSDPKNVIPDDEERRKLVEIDSKNKSL